MVDTKAVPSNLVLTGPLDQDTFDELRQQASALLEADEDILVDCGEVAHLDLATLQLLLALRVSLASRKKEIHLTEVGEPLRNWLRISGVSEAFSSVA